jgi:hypothetical protein
MSSPSDTHPIRKPRFPGRGFRFLYPLETVARAVAFTGPSVAKAESGWASARVSGNCTACHALAEFGIGAACLQGESRKRLRIRGWQRRQMAAQRELTEAAKSPHQDSEHHDENTKATDCNHQGNLPTRETRPLGFEGTNAKQDKQQWTDKQRHERFFGVCRGRWSTPNRASSSATSSFEPTLIIFISLVCCLVAGRFGGVHGYLVSRLFQTCFVAFEACTWGRRLHSALWQKQK